MSDNTALDKASDSTEKHNKQTDFVNYVITQCQKNKGFAARLKRADNPATEYQSWDILAHFNIDLEKPYERLPYALIGSAIAKSDVDSNGSLLLGDAIAKSFDEGNQSEQAKARLLRLLACSDMEELVRILRPLLGLIESRSKQHLDYSKLLSDLVYFSYDQQRIKARWAQQFYAKYTDNNEE